MNTKFYASKSNAKRAAKATGVNVETVKFVEQGCKWTWETPKQGRSKLVESNGIKQPAPGGACRKVWDFCAAKYENEGVVMKPKAMKEVAAEKGWNATNAVLSMYKWRKFANV